MSKRNETAEDRAARKELVKQQKAEKKARREGHVDESYGQKQCTLCEQPKDLLIRCYADPFLQDKAAILRIISEHSSQLVNF